MAKPKEGGKERKREGRNEGRNDENWPEPLDKSRDSFIERVSDSRERRSWTAQLPALNRERERKRERIRDMYVCIESPPLWFLCVCVRSVNALETDE